MVLIENIGSNGLPVFFLLYKHKKTICKKALKTYLHFKCVSKAGESMNQNRTLSLFSKLFLRILFGIITDFIILILAYEFLTIFWFYFLFAIIVLASGYYIFKSILKLKDLDDKEDSFDALVEILDDLEYAKPLNLSIDMKQENGLVEETLHHHEELEQMIEPEEKITRQDKPIELSDFIEQLHVYIKEQGLKIDKDNLKEMFASMAASKLLMVKNHTVEHVEKFTQAFTKFIGAKLYIDDASHLKSFNELLSSDYTLNQLIEEANQNPNKIYFMGYKHLNFMNLDKKISPIIDYALNPSLPSHIKTTLGHVLPNNVWFILYVGEHDHTYEIQSATQSSVYIDLEATEVEPKVKTKQKYLRLSYLSFSNILFDSYEKYYLDETIWKKIDQLEAYLNETASFNIDNRLFRQFERYASAYLLFGGEKEAVLDHILYSKILNILLSLKSFREQLDTDEMLSMFDNIFGLENLNKSKRTLKKLMDETKQ